jgi:hypothetical protein
VATSSSNSTVIWHSVSQKFIHTSVVAVAAVYGTGRKICHFLYTDDLKLIGRSEEELRNEIRIVKANSNDKN